MDCNAINAFETEQAIAAWEDEGGSGTRIVEPHMIGTLNQIAWAKQIKIQVETEFDRVRSALESAAIRQSGQRRAYTQAMIVILENKRAEVMANEQAGYFIHDWQEVRGQVRDLILGDPRYKAMKFGLSGENENGAEGQAPGVSVNRARQHLDQPHFSELVHEVINTRACRAMSKLFVGNLSFKVTNADLQNWFESNGYPVESAQIVADHKTGRSRGIGFVVLKRNDQLKDAIKNLNGQNFSDRTVVVEEAKSPASNEGPHPQKRGRW